MANDLQNGNNGKNDAVTLPEQASDKAKTVLAFLGMSSNAIAKCSTKSALSKAYVEWCGSLPRRK